MADVVWRVAQSLQQLLAQLNALAPKRSKLSDGAIGDAAHATRTSDHNPWYVLGGEHLVTARDFTHDPKGGLDCQKLANALTACGDKRIKYVIWNKRIWEGKWTAYDGPNPHTKHLHLSVVASPLCDTGAPWVLPGLQSGGSPPPIAPAPAQEVPDVDQRQDALLTGCYHQLSGSPNLGEWPGWPSFPGGSGNSLTLVDYVRQADVQLNKIQADLDSIKSSGAAPGALSDNDISRIAAAVIDEFARRAAA